MTHILTAHHGKNHDEEVVKKQKKILKAAGITIEQVALCWALLTRDRLYEYKSGDRFYSSWRWPFFWEDAFRPRFFDAFFGDR